jgi:5-formyltetrahydrofolate cyclo-ligase
MEPSDKSALRARVRELLRALTPENRTALSQTLCNIARCQQTWQQARAILFFAPLADEADLTPTGRRLGRGKGFYDRLLAEFRGHKCGVAFDAQIVATVPEEPHDVRVDSILTPAGWRVCHRPV